VAIACPLPFTWRAIKTRLLMPAHKSLPERKGVRNSECWYWHKSRHEDQWKRTEDPDMKPHNYNQLVFDKGAKNT
jgi:hypothetical protein